MAAIDPRTQRLHTRGTIVTGCSLVMAALSVLFPRRIWPADTDREPELDPENWVLGGTSPGGAPMGLGTEDGHGNWWIGNPETYAEIGTPHRIVWALPGPGEEAFEPAERTGYRLDYSVDPGAPQNLQPASPAMDFPAPPPGFLPPRPPSGEETEGVNTPWREMGTQATAPFATRIIPMTAHLWGNDVDDAEELLYYVAQAVQLCFNGNAVGRPLLGAGGFVADEKGSRGLHYQLRVTFAAPIAYPTYDEVAMRSALLRIIPGGPHVVI